VTDHTAAENSLIDTAFDFTTDTPGWPRTDPDKRSPVLRRYHQLLWSKPLPSGIPFLLDVTTPRTYLHHSSELGEFALASDAVIPCFGWHLKKLGLMYEVHPPPPGDGEGAELTGTLAGEFATFYHLAYTIGGMMIWPVDSARGKSINQDRGMNKKIRDRFDLTVECIRRHYAEESSPLTDTLGRYADFFQLFGDFRGFVDFFLLQNVVTEDYSSVRFFMPFEGFTGAPLPSTLEEYRAYMGLTTEFLHARNRRIDGYARS
jgi:Family of unknown function (DUF6994)